MFRLSWRSQKLIIRVDKFRSFRSQFEVTKMAPKVERIVESVQLGEGPHWDIPSQSLYFVDVFKQSILKYHPSTNKLTRASVVPNGASFIIPVEGKKDQFLVGSGEDLAIISWDGESDKVELVEKLASVQDKTKFNDGKVDSSGRLWAGTLNLDREDATRSPPVGTLFSLDSKKNLKPHASKIKLSNGLAFNEKEGKLYYIDSLKNGVDQYDFDVVAGTISNQKVLFSLPKHNIEGFPDGMTIDADGNLWVAVFGGNRVIKIDGRKPETLLQTVEIPALQVTSAAFGGPHLDELYVTTASIESRGQKAPPPPANGATYRVTGLGIKGLPGVNYKLQ